MCGNQADNATGSHTWSQDAPDAQDANLTSLASGWNTDAPDILKIFADECLTEFCNFYRRFINSFSRIAPPLYQLTTKKRMENWIWREKEQNSFNQRKMSLTTARVLIYFVPNEPIMVETHASNYVCSGILSQQQDDGTWRPVAYKSKTMSKAQCNYDIHDKELLAIMQALRKWRKYCEGAKHTVRILTGH